MTLIGSVVERTPDAANATTSLTPFPVSADPKTGFPAAMHRSQRQRKSAFRQNMEAARPINRDAIPIVQTTSDVTDAQPFDPDESWRSTMEADNARRVALMTEEEREEELRQLQSKFGDIAELADVLRRAKDTTPRAVERRPTSPTIEEITDEESVPPLKSSSPPPVHNPQHRVASTPRPVLSRRGSVSGGSRPASGAGTPGVRFAEVTSRDVFTYPSAPASPKRASLMIEAPPAEGSGAGVTKLQWQGKLAEPEAVQPDSEAQPDLTQAPGPATEPEQEKHHSAHPLSQVTSSSSGSTPPELKVTTDLPAAHEKTQLAPPAYGIAFPALSPIDDTATPEAIRRQYFPSEPQNNPNLEWIADLPEIPDTPVTSQYAYIDGLGEKERFNLAGTPIPQDLAKEMPVHDGLHHNSRTSAGKSRSTWAWACKAGVGAVCVGVAAAVSLKAAL